MFHLFYVCLFFCFSTPVFSLEPDSVKNNTSSSQELTLAIIKPDAVQKHKIGEIIAQIEKSGLSIVGIKMGTLSKEEASEFYAAHKQRPFYNDLTNFMSSGPIVALAIQGPDAVNKTRKIIGSTDPSQAEAGTLRRWFGTSVTQNAVHGSDSLNASKEELFFFFDSDELPKN